MTERFRVTLRKTVNARFQLRNSQIGNQRMKTAQNNSYRCKWRETTDFLEEVMNNKRNDK